MPVLRYPGGNELRQTGDPADQQRDLDRRLRQRCGSATPRPSTGPTRRPKSWRARTSPPPDPSFPKTARRALDLLGFSSQLVFNTFHNGRLHDMEHADADLAYAAARAHNRGMLEFCAVDAAPAAVAATSRWPTRHGPWPPPRTRLAQGAAALLIASGCPPRHSPSHTDLFGVWARAEEAGIPVVFHVGGTGTLIDPNYFVNGKPVPPDFHGGEENFRSVDYMGIPVPPAQTLATLIFDGVLEAFPDLRIGVIEQGAIWVPSWLRQMESAFEAFHRHEERLQGLSLRPSDYVHRQCRFTPYPTEDVGWIVEQAGADLVLFSSDYPHVEGGRKPLERFEASLGDADADVRRQFYTDNFLFLMGSAGRAAA